MTNTTPGLAASATPFVVCVVLNWNGWQDTLACLESLLAQEYPALEVVVVDNASTDDSVVRIQAAFPQIRVISARTNGGFSSGCNLGIRYALERHAAFVWLLNNDTITPPDTASLLVAAARKDDVDARIGMVGTVLRYMDDPARVQAWGGGTVTRTLGFSRHYTAPAELGEDSYLTFASVLLRCDMLVRIGLLDEGFFMYYEDSDLSFRARRAGWQLAVAAGTAVLHKEGGATQAESGAKAPQRAVTDRIVTGSGVRFLRRWGMPRPLAPALYILSRLGKRLLRADFAGMSAVMKGVGDWWRETPQAFQADLPQKRSGDGA